jgi:hypothetical protein
MSNSIEAASEPVPVAAKPVEKTKAKAKTAVKKAPAKKRVVESDDELSDDSVGMLDEEEAPVVKPGRGRK